MADYLYLFRGGNETRGKSSPEAMQEHMMKWKIWMDKLAAQGKLMSGLPLQDEGKVISGSAKQLLDGPYMEGKEMVGGYLIVSADTLDEAAEMSKECPIFEHEGSVEIRELASMTMHD